MSPSDNKLVSKSQTVAQALYARDIAAQRLGINVDFVDEHLSHDLVPLYFEVHSP